MMMHGLANPKFTGKYLPVNMVSFLSKLISSVYQMFLLKISTVGDRRPTRSRKEGSK
jgi:hypothetical protein